MTFSIRQLFCFVSHLNHPALKPLVQLLNCVRPRKFGPTQILVQNFEDDDDDDYLLIWAKAPSIIVLQFLQCARVHCAKFNQKIIEFLTIFSCSFFDTSIKTKVILPS